MQTRPREAEKQTGRRFNEKNLKPCKHNIAHKGYGSIAHEAKPNGLLTRGSNCFSITQLVGQKKSNNKVRVQVEERFSFWE